uniref:Uncharacterized protein n=1 Tax=Panagrolaimus sp. ES5 TaxID=591445 RepID=A0AC34GW10_9BILA
MNVYEILSKRAAAATKLSDFTDLIDSQAETHSNSWDKSNKNLSPNFLNLNRASEGEIEFMKSKSANNSTLSLHIAAYENSVEASADFNEEVLKMKGAKQLLTDLPSLSQNSFEFPRQQKEDPSNQPELMQFKASQDMHNPNKGTSDQKETHYHLIKGCFVSEKSVEASKNGMDDGKSLKTSPLSPTPKAKADGKRKRKISQPAIRKHSGGRSTSVSSNSSVTSEQNFGAQTASSSSATSTTSSNNLDVTNNTVTNVAHTEGAGKLDAESKETEEERKP